MQKEARRHALDYHLDVGGEASIPAPGDVVGGRYRVDAPVGEGGTAVVLAATAIDSGERVAIKVLREQYAASPDLRARHLREARALSALKSPHVARVFDVGAFPSGATFLVLEYLDGLDLHDVLSELGAFEPALAASLLRQACDGVEQAHRAGIWHRDIKPSNLFAVRAAGGLACVKVLDFGLAKLTVEGVSAVTARGDVMGSPSYMAPEQICGLDQAGPLSDVWSLGVTLYELLTNELPFEATTPTRIANAVLNERPVPIDTRRGDLPPSLVALVARCLEKDPLKRPASARAVGDALRAFAGPSVRYVTLCGGGDDAPRRERPRRPARTVQTPEPTYGGLLPIVAAPESVRVQVTTAREADDDGSAQATLVRVPVERPVRDDVWSPAAFDTTRGEPTEVRLSTITRTPRRGVAVVAWSLVIAVTLFGTALLVVAWVMRTGAH